MTDSADKVDLSDVIDLSVVELYILNYLIRVAGSVVRFSVFNDINSQLSEKTISRSSFYNSLDNLREKGFIDIDDTDKGKKSTVRALPKAKAAVQQINIFNIWGSVDPDNKFKDLLQSYFGENDHLQENCLLISFQYPTNVEIVELLQENFSEVKLVGNETTIGPVFAQYETVDVDSGGIIERNDHFDTIFIYRYAYNEILFPFDFVVLFNEVCRLIKPGGQLIFLALEDLQTTSNLILESGIGKMLEDTLESQSTENLQQLIKRYQEGKQQKAIKSVASKQINGLSMFLLQF